MKCCSASIWLQQLNYSQLALYKRIRLPPKKPRISSVGRGFISKSIRLLSVAIGVSWYSVRSLPSTMDIANKLNKKVAMSLLLFMISSLMLALILHEYSLNSVPCPSIAVIVSENSNCITLPNKFGLFLNKNGETPRVGARLASNDVLQPVPPNFAYRSWFLIAFWRKMIISTN